MLRSALLVAGLAAFACSKGSSGAPAVAADVAEAGDVREVSGTVTAHRGSAAPRALAVGDVVAGDDVIDTGGDGSVVIELRHNGVRWSLGANQSKQVSQSAAWAAPRAGGAGGSSSDDRDTAAGRHAERSAADTAESAVENHADTAAPPTDQPGSGGGGPTTPVTPPTSKPAHHRPPAARTTAKSDAKMPDLQPETPGDSDMTNGLANLSTDSGGGGSIGGGGTGESSGTASPAGHVSISTTDDRGDVEQTIARKYQAGFTRCYKNLLKQDPEAKGKLTITFTVKADGTVSGVSVDAGGAIAGVHDCVAGVMRGAKVGAQSSESDYSLVIDFQPS